MDPTSDAPGRSTLEKLRQFMGFLMNMEDILGTGDFDLAGAYTFAVGTFERLEATSAKIPASIGQEVERDLVRRLEEIIRLVDARQPNHGVLPRAKRAWSEWQRVCPDGTLPTREPTGDPDASEIFGVSTARLLHLHAQLAAGPLPHEFAASFVMFLAGLHHGTGSLASAKHFWAKPGRDDLSRLSLEGLEVAVRFALESEPQALVRATVRLPAETAFHCLFMGVAYIQGNPSPGVRQWMQVGPAGEKRARLFFAMGVQAAHAPCARRFVRSIGSQLVGLVGEHLGSRMKSLVETFGSARPSGPS